SRLLLQIAAGSVGLYPKQPPVVTSDVEVTQLMAPSPQMRAAGVVRLLSGALADFIQFAEGENTGWLVDLAHDICD
ncbi:hypothetical protein DFH09DRAFT_863823, partial [Mycena vulgaris]